MIYWKKSACLFVLALLASCDSRLEVPKGAESEFLFALKSSQSLGDGPGNVALYQNNVHVHPGATKPTSVGFSIDGRLHSMTFRPFIAKLNEQGEQLPEAGIVGFETLVDGKSIEKIIVDRHTNVEKTLNLKGAKSLEFRVDNGNGTPVFDWFMVQVTAIN